MILQRLNGNLTGILAYPYMMLDQSNPTQDLIRLKAAVDQLQDRLRLLEQERKQQIEKQRRRLVIIGGGLSLLIHILLLIYLSTLYTSSIGSGGGQEISVQFASLDEEQLTELEQSEFDELEVEQVSADESLPTQATELTTAAPSIEMTIASAGSVPMLGGAGQATGEGLGLGGGGGAGVSFFGVSSKGTRFAYIVDISGSMGQGQRLTTAMRELARSIDSLPDYASFYILLFSDDVKQPPMQKGWTRARKSVVRQYIRWFNDVDPTGGTQPRTSFMQVFSLDTRPDVIFFLTDGEFGDITAEEVAALNSRGKKAVINTIQFGEPGKPELLKKIAEQSGGVYRFVASGG